MEKEFDNVDELIVYNFLKHLKVKGVNQRQYEIDNDLSESTVSKWKAKKSLMSAQHISQAAKYFNITVNELYYNERDLRAIQIKNKKNYVEIPPHQLVTVKIDKTTFINAKEYTKEKYFGLSFICFICFIFFDKIPYLIVLPLLMGISFFIDFKKKILIEKIYSINYKEKLFLKIDDNTIKNYNLLKVSHFLIIILFLILSIIISLNITSIFSFINIARIYFLVLSIFSILSTIMILSELQKQLPSKIYNSDIRLYFTSVINSDVNFIFMLSAILYLRSEDNLKFFYIIFSVIAIIVSLITFFILNKKFSQYKLTICKSGDLEEVLNINY